MTRSLEKKNERILNDEISTKSGWELTRFGEVSPNLVYILLDLKYFDQKLTEKCLNHLILVSFIVGSVEEGFRGENLLTNLSESVFGICNPPPTVGALGSVVGGSVPVRFSRLGWVRVWVDTPNWSYKIFYWKCLHTRGLI